MTTSRTIKGYQLREQIGAGGFGEVWRADQTSIDHPVAIKFILPKFANHPDFIRRFEAEAQLVARLEHLHIVPLFDYWRDPDGAYLVMRYLRGGSLKKAIADGGLELPQVGQTINQITAALDRAHQQGVIHRDIKPSNIMLDEDENAYLSDFGIAKDLLGSADLDTQSGHLMASPPYAAPEQARSDPVSPRTDIYSLGVTLYEMLMGEHPFPNLSAVELFYKHLNEPLPELKNLPTDISDSINEVIQKATAKNPAHRYADALELAAAFRQAANLDSHRSDSSVVEILTQREQEILQLLIENRSNKEIAAALVVAPSTVKWYNRQIFKKLGVNSRVQAIVRARELDLIVPSSEAGHALELTYIPTEDFQPENPYKGLRAFQSADNQDFFGREKITDKLIKRLNEKDDLSRFLAVVGPSGSGKSSLVKAGLIPAIWRGDIPNSEKWYIIDMIPGAYPFDELEVALMKVAANQSDNLHEQLTRDDRGLIRVGQLILPDDDTELLIVIDQFEEVFTLIEDEKIRTRFLNMLYKTVTDKRSRVRIVVTLRADFYDRPLQYPHFGELIRNRMETVLPLTAKELEIAIVKPAARTGVTFEEGLVAHISDEVAYQPGALPLLQYGLTELFEKRDGRVLTHTAYQAVGGAVGALAKRADDIYHEYDDAGQATIRQLFLRLVTLGEGTEDTRRRVHRTELLSLTHDVDLMDDIIDTYAAYRLLSLDHDPATRTPTVEVAHEAILREWERLRTWLNDGREDVKMQRRLAHAAQEWAEHGQDRAYLLRESRLTQFDEWAAQTKLALTPHERAYLDTSILAEEQSRTQEMERLDQKRALERRVKRGLQTLIAVFLVATVIAIGLALFAFAQRSTAQTERDNAQRAFATSDANFAQSQRQSQVNRSLVLANAARNEYENGRSDLALALALEAVSIPDPLPEVQLAFREIIESPGSSYVFDDPDSNNHYEATDMNNDGSLAVFGGCFGETLPNTQFRCAKALVSLWDVENRQIIRRFELDGIRVFRVLFTPNGQNVLGLLIHDCVGWGTPEEVCRASAVLWNLNGEEIRRFSSPYGLSDIAYSLDGKYILTSGYQNQDWSESDITLWDVESGEDLQHFQGSAGSSVTFSPDARYLAYADPDYRIVLWDIIEGKQRQFDEGHTNFVSALKFTPDARYIFSSGNSSIRLWDVTTGAEIHSTSLPVASPDYLDFSPDGRIAVFSNGNDLTIWDMVGWREIHSFADQPQWLNGASLSIDGNIALTAGSNGTIYFWKINPSPPLSQFQLNEAVYDLELSSDGQFLLAGTVGGTAYLVDSETGGILQRFEGQDGLNFDVELNDDGSVAAISSGDALNHTLKRSLTLWDTSTGSQIQRFDQFDGYMTSAAFTSDGNILGGTYCATSLCTFATLFEWDISDGQFIRQFETDDYDVWRIRVSASGDLMATASNISHSLRLWDYKTGEPIRKFEEIHSQGIWDISFTPDEQRMLSASGDGTLILWDVNTGEAIRRFTGHIDEVTRLDISPDGRYAISGGTDGLLILWDLATGEELRRYAGPEGFVFGVAFSPDGQSAFSSTATENNNSTIIQWDVRVPLIEELVNWAHENRYIREFTQEECEKYGYISLCDP